MSEKLNFFKKSAPNSPISKPAVNRQPGILRDSHATQRVDRLSFVMRCSIHTHRKSIDDVRALSELSAIILRNHTQEKILVHWNSIRWAGTWVLTPPLKTPWCCGDCKDGDSHIYKIPEISPNIWQCLRRTWRYQSPQPNSMMPPRRQKNTAVVRNVGSQSSTGHQ